MRLEIIIADLDPNFCAHASEAFGSVLSRFPHLSNLAVLVETIDILGACQLQAPTPVGHGGPHMCMQQGPSLLWGAEAEQEEDCWKGNPSSSTGPKSAHGIDLCPSPLMTNDDAATCMVFGGNSAGAASGRLQHVVSEAFPEEFKDIASQIRFELGDEWDGRSWPQDRQGSIHAAGGDRGFWLLSVVTFPRDAQLEMEHTQYGFRDALRYAVHTAAGYASEAQSRTIRVVTHGLGCFTGHPEPGKFAESMARGLEEFLYTST